MTLTSHIFKVVIILLLLQSGLVHAGNPFMFLQSVAAYELVPRSAIGMFLIIPYLEIAIAVCLITGAARYTATFIAMVMFAVFAFAQLIVIVQGRKISSGSFGYSSAEIGPLTLSVAIGAIFLCAFILWHDGTRHNRALALPDHPGAAIH
jgi:putative oxidoreductase